MSAASIDPQVSSKEGDTLSFGFIFLQEGEMSMVCTPLWRRCPRCKLRIAGKLLTAGNKPRPGPQLPVGIRVALTYHTAER